MTDTVKAKILIIDDDQFLLDMYTIKFKQSGFDVHASMGSVDALSKLKNGLVPDVILSDIVMPAMDGFELIDTVKKDNLAPHSCFVVLSNLGQRSDIEKGKQLGVDGYIVKASATPSEVVAKVTELINEKACPKP
ncbi:MAG: hypothetical protein A2408_00570 [Candidatus Yonathbacteria bacterium RIFOXYC1_FULL_52_10]|uniref:Response regulatory domain-containing protein n=1 Tax=Candidatus Yonathbacteria bacterium RIFOXYD1_FULL_52_36 TaxID=1802730 RepID=A0A1G2SID6_9BACT|nr:MAG: hypothetical protein A2408_00570 [Candidatus Yonathbacteria bacterium RIFOXYC1_FULL_52_10]OHA84843.1 MAG: hypothetical protein A2591_00735 [Candidatus Yonathbacteria bacterium RIFOXYD1_FULL_52_36]